MKKQVCSGILLTILFFGSSFAQKSQKVNSSMMQKKSADTHSYSKFNINNISTYIFNNGITDYNRNWEGLEYPKGSDKVAIYQSGFAWGGIIDTNIYVGGSNFNTGLKGGRILATGIPQNTEDQQVRVYRVRPDYKISTLEMEIKDEDLSYDEIFLQYQKDWNEWPAEDGAPFDDKNNDGVYNPLTDIPGIPGAHQTLWYVANDFDTLTCREVYGSDPMNLELQVTFWGYNIPGHLENIMFKKYKIISKGTKKIKNMYLAQWGYGGIGDIGDNYAGVDTLLNLGYFYNADNFDELYGSIIPSFGFQYLEGPIRENLISDPPKIINSFFHYMGGWYVPDNGQYSSGTLRYYNHMQGLDHESFPVSIPKEAGGGTTKFQVSGNPITGEGWIDGILYGPSSRQFNLTSGPFDLEIGDSVEVVIAEIAALGHDYLNSVALLKYYSSLLQNEYPDFQVEQSISNLHQLKPSISQKEFSEYDVIELNIERNDSFENFTENGYAFQGYNIYQSSQPTEYFNAAYHIATYDKIDDVVNIYGNTYDPSTGYLQNGIVFNGSDNGIPKSVKITKDYITNSELIKGKTYYFGISSYYYNQAENKTVESPLDTISVIYQKDLPGPKYLDKIEHKIVSGNSDAQITLEVINPYELTGDEYEITFGQQHYYLDESEIWQRTKYPDRVGKESTQPNDQINSKLLPLPSIYSFNNTIEVHFLLEINSPDYNSANGIIINFPPNVKINHANYGFYNHSGVVEGQKVIWGKVDSVSGDGYFYGGEDLMVNIDFIEPTFTVEYEIIDDGWSEKYALETGDSSYYNFGEGTINGKGFLTLNGVTGYKFKSVKYANIWNKTLNELVAEEIEIERDYPYYLDEIKDRAIITEKSVDGFYININGTFKPAIDFYKVVLNDESTISQYSFHSKNYAFQDETYSSGYYEYPQDFDNSADDYEYRFTGIPDSTIINGKKVYITKEGTGSLATFDWGNPDEFSEHPLNNGGLDRFLVRVPFEVWNKDLNIQVNCIFYNYSRQNPNSEGFYVWNPKKRMEVQLVNTPYKENIISNKETQYTRSHFWYTSNYSTGDVLEIYYHNPLKFSDVYTFTMPEAPTDKISPNQYEVFQNYPNPFNPNTKIRYFIPEEGNVTITIYNILGQRVTEVINKNVNAGKYETEFNGSNLASGVYIYRIEIDSPAKANIYSETKKMLLLK